MVECWPYSRSVSADAARDSRDAKKQSQERTRAKGDQTSTKDTKNPIDPLYRAAMLAARDLNTAEAPSRSSASMALAAVLERFGIDVRWPESKGGTKPVGVFEWGNDGVMVTVSGDDRTADWGGIGRLYRWQRIHLVHMTERALTIRTVAI